MLGERVYVYTIIESFCAHASCAYEGAAYRPLPYHLITDYRPAPSSRPASALASARAATTASVEVRKASSCHRASAVTMPMRNGCLEQHGGNGVTISQVSQSGAGDLRRPVSNTHQTVKPVQNNHQKGNCNENREAAHQAR